MNAAEIREWAGKLMGPEPEKIFLIQATAEVAAQLAENNEHLAKMANPLMVVTAESPWVTFKRTGKFGGSFSVDRNSVLSVVDQDHSGRNQSPQPQRRRRASL
jgi:hypothetical protein